ncbi:hypothetical protein OAU52_00880 [bacterium]|nr:hypothetical protein [bacterium]
MEKDRKELIEVGGRDWKQIARYFQYAVFVVSMILSGVMIYFLLNMEEIMK